ncbi:MAG: AraC family transcriptional regulator [Clostridiales bacterium]|jgi:AraC-like DNA-binding protein|nr:AraC family transcriptional regulator [Clostridiales bacterium]MDR2750667.1 AraC family transcriptional regulator [Clostridiales bacterium]
MAGSIYERIAHVSGFPAKAFVTCIQNSTYHWHSDYELMIVLGGEVRLFEGPEHQMLRTGDVVLLNSRVVHGYRSNDPNNLCLFVQFSERVFEELLDERMTFRFYLNSASGVYPPKNGYDPIVVAACKLGYYMRQTSPSAAYKAASSFFGLLAELLDNVVHDIRRAPLSAGKEPEDELAARVSDFISANCSSQTLAEDITREFGLNEKSIYRCLKNALGATQKELTDIARIERSKLLLRHTSMSILDIAQECGFISEATFYRTFKKETGITPKEFRDGGLSLPTGFEVQGYLNYDSMDADVRLARLAGLA